MQIKPSDLTQAIEDLSMCEFFPSDPGAQSAIMRLLAKICPSREALQWLVSTFVNRIGKWHGPTELRAVLATKYRPNDGIEAYSAIPGFRGQDSEDRLIEQHEQIKQGGWALPPALNGKLKLIAGKKGL